MPRAIVLVFAMLLSIGAAARERSPQLGALVSPGRLTKAHAELEGIRQCQSCHEAGRRVTAQKCLACHKSIAERIGARKGVHRAVADDCVTCHVEHMGPEAELRPFDVTKFNHATETGFALDGRHASIATQCSACHKSRSFLGLSTACASCHQDPHKGSLGASCTTCHSTSAPFKETTSRFDHSKTAFPLAGAHRTTACTGCHPNQVFKGLKFAQCGDCHKDPHQARFGATCSTCHAADAWRTRRVDHSRTAFPLVGRHADVDCAKCHTQPALRVKPKSATCGACHADVHKGTFNGDCRTCHTEAGFAKAPFDHTTTKFPLTGKHGETTCARCHASPPASGPGRATAVVEFSGLSAKCVSCHADVHRGELGAACETCHSSTTFTLSSFNHARHPEFFGGAHRAVACDGCHRREPVTVPVRTSVAVESPRFAAATTRCVSCHRDPHLGQVTQTCETCHALALPRFQLVADFSHTRTRFPLTGRHETTECRQCHKEATGVFPAGSGTATRLTGLESNCRACHEDAHLGQVGGACETCHTTQTFHVGSYTHRNRALRAFFVGKHAAAACEACHPRVDAQFPAGRGTAARLSVGTACVNCHRDIHNGALGPNCADCHRPLNELAFNSGSLVVPRGHAGRVGGP